MGGIALLLGFELAGLVCSERLFARMERVVRLWLGLSLGLILMMWLPALWAFAIDFTVTAQLLGLACAAALAVAAWFLLPARCASSGRQGPGVPLRTLLAVLIPYAILGAWLMYSHYLREVNGALYAGQSTYGDMCLHLGIATGLKNASFPPEYTILPGTTLGYPFLSDTLVTSMLLMGTGLSQAFVVSGTLMFVLVGLGFFLLAWKLTGRRGATAAAFLLMFLNGGLGFAYAIDMIGVDGSAFRDIFSGFYMTPTNQPDLNLRWVNVIADMMVPQRTLLGGWIALIPAIYLLVDATKKTDWRRFLVLGVWASAIPLIHTHSFLALGLLSAGAMAYCLIRPARGTDRMQTLVCFAVYGGVALLLSLPQLMKFAFPQTTGGGVLRLMFNWVNNNQGMGEMLLKDDYLWFWVKNVGLIFLVFVPAALSADRQGRMLSCGAACIFAVSELVLFQQNVYDNNKLFYVAYIVMVPVAMQYLSGIFDRLKGVKGRAFFTALFLFVSCLSGSLSLMRESVSTYQVFGRTEVAAAETAQALGDPEDVFLTGTQHLNPISALAGRKIVCGPGLYLYYHGLDYAQQDADVRLMLESPAENLALFEKYHVRYVYLSSYERNDYQVDEAFFRENGACVFEKGGVFIFDISGIQVHN